MCRSEQEVIDDYVRTCGHRVVVIPTAEELAPVVGRTFLMRRRVEVKAAIVRLKKTIEKEKSDAH